MIRIRSEKLDNDRVAIEFQEKKALPQKYPESTPVTCKMNDSTRGGGVCEVADARAGGWSGTEPSKSTVKESCLGKSGIPPVNTKVACPCNHTASFTPGNTDAGCLTIKH